MPNKYVAQRIKLFDAQLETPFTRADIQLLGLRHAGASYEASIFINNPNADLSTEPTLANGYAGCFFYLDMADMTKTVTITSPLRRLIDPAREFTVTFVADPMPYKSPDDGRPYLPEFNVDRENVLEFDQLRVVTYD